MWQTFSVNHVLKMGYLTSHQIVELCVETLRFLAITYAKINKISPS
jgi:hypothetical protein